MKLRCIIESILERHHYLWWGSDGRLDGLFPVHQPQSQKHEARFSTPLSLILKYLHSTLLWRRWEVCWNPLIQSKCRHVFSFHFPRVCVITRRPRSLLLLPPFVHRRTRYRPRVFVFVLDTGFECIFGTAQRLKKKGSYSCYLFSQILWYPSS